MPPRFQQFTERSDVVGSDLTAPTNDTGARIQPFGGKFCILLWIKIVSRLQHVDHTTRLECIDGGKTIRIGAKSKARFSQDGHGLRDCLWLRAVNDDRQRLEGVDCGQRVREQFSGAQKLARCHRQR